MGVERAGRVGGMELLRGSSVQERRKELEGSHFCRKEKKEGGWQLCGGVTNSTFEAMSFLYINSVARPATSS